MPTDGEEEFRSVDWAEVGSDRASQPGARTVLFVAAVLAVVAVLAYGRVADPLPVVGEWGLLDWLTWVSALALALLVAPAVGDTARRRAALRSLRQRPTTALAAVSVGGFVLAGTVGPVVLGRPELAVGDATQPPMFASIDQAYVVRCVGPVIEGRCHGTATYPLGTDNGGKGTLRLALMGTRNALRLALVTSAIIVPLATVVGTVGAYLRGWVDELLMRLVDIQTSIPAFFIYIVLLYVYGRSLLLLIVVFGLFSWGSVARLVRSDALAHCEALYVTASESAGGSRRHVLRQHVVRNAAPMAVVAATLQVPLLVITEVTLSFLGFGDPQLLSWGQSIAAGLSSLRTYPWIAAVPTATLCGALLSLNVLGDGLRDLFDPRTR